MGRETYKCLILPGNESRVIAECLRRRGCWEFVDASTTDVNFWWGGNGQTADFKTLKTLAPARRRKLVISKLENHNVICRKASLFRTLQSYCNSKNIPMESFFPETHVLTAGVSTPSRAQFRKAFANNTRRKSQLAVLSQGRSLSVKGTIKPTQCPTQHRSLRSPNARRASMDSNVKLSKKPEKVSVNTTKSLKKTDSGVPSKKTLEKTDPTNNQANCTSRTDSNPIEIAPGGGSEQSSTSTDTGGTCLTTTVTDATNEGDKKVSVNVKSTEFPEETMKCDGDATSGLRKGSSGRMWIVKPDNMNRGRGIEVFDSPSDIEKHIDKQKPGSTWIVQKYIERPLLLHPGRKFDLRVFALALHDGRVFVHEDPFLRCCSTLFDANDLSNPLVHVTNCVVHVGSTSYGQYEEENRMSLDEFQTYFDNHYGSGIVDVRGHIFSQIRFLINLVFRASMKLMNPNKFTCFELFGLDFLINEDLEVSLIEVNTSPALFLKGKYLQYLIPRVLEECLQKGLDPILPKPNHTNGDTKTEISDNELPRTSPDTPVHEENSGNENKTDDGRGCAPVDGAKDVSDDVDISKLCVDPNTSLDRFVLLNFNSAVTEVVRNLEQIRRSLPKLPQPRS
eukprot:Rmarinus@m.5037